MDGEGTVDMLRARTEAFIARYPQHANRVLGRPEVRVVKADVQIATLKAENRELAEKVATLEAKLLDAESRLKSALSIPLADRPASAIREVSIEEVMVAFCNACAIHDVTVDDDPITIEALKAVRRYRDIAWPRIIAIWLVGRICYMRSQSQIGEAFGGRDHTTVVNANQRALFVMEQVPALRLVVDSVMAKFRS